MSKKQQQQQQLVLTGTADELKSPQARQILAACYVAGLDCTCQEGKGSASGADSSIVGKPPPCCSGGGTLRLRYGDGGGGIDIPVAPNGTAAIRLVGNLAPAVGLFGRGDHHHPADGALVDSWCGFVQSSLSVPFRLQKNAPAAALQQLDAHLKDRSFLVGDALTAADIVLAGCLLQASEAQLWKEGEEEYGNLARWYDSIKKQDWFVQVLSAEDPVAAPGAPTTTVTAVAGGDCGVLMNGTPTPVQYKLYRRKRVRIKELLSPGGQKEYMDRTVTVAGWARTVRKQGAKLLFVELSDGSCGATLQCVLHDCPGLDDCKNDRAGGTGASFSFQGTLVASQGQGQAVELQVSQATLLGAVFAGNLEGTKVGGEKYPLSKKEHGLEHLREHAHLRARGALHAAAMRVRHAMAFATHHFFHSHGFLYIHTPIITGADCEGAGEQFAVTTLLGGDPDTTDLNLPKHEKRELSKSEMKRLAKAKGKADPNKPQHETVVGAVDYEKDFFGQRVNLTVSGQLNVETHACALSDVYTFGPTFRAETSFTSRHLSEFWMIEPEIAFADLEDDINLAEDYLKYCVRFALEHCAEDLEFFERSQHGEVGLRDRLKNVLDNPFKRLTYTDAIELLQKAVKEDGAEFEVTPEWGIDLPSEHERYICEKIYGRPVVLYDYPKEIKSFYMKLNQDNKTVQAADILVPKIGEIIGGSAREHRLDVLKARCVEMNLDPRAVWWYLDLRRYGTVPHAGFGLGFERLCLFVTGLANIRDVIPFPRWAGNAKF